MAENSKIEWTDHTFNPWTGCTKVSPGCDHCYAEGWAKRAGTVQWGNAPRRRTTEANWRLPLKWNAQAEREGRRFRVFCASLADVFDNQVPQEWRDDLFRLIEETPHLDWLLLTKRIGNVGNMLPVPFDFDRHYPNVWIGATITSQAEADRDIPKLMKVPARVRFLSMEPLLGPVDLKLMQYEDSEDRDEDGKIIANTRRRCLRWVIVGGESGPGARPMHPDWARSLRDQCAAGGVPFLFKQWGEFAEADLGNVDAARADRFIEVDGTDSTDRTVDRHSTTTAHMVHIGKKAAGRLLDGCTHDGYPSGVAIPEGGRDGR